jgi:hypothetical protein
MTTSPSAAATPSPATTPVATPAAPAPATPAAPVEQDLMQNGASMLGNTASKIARIRSFFTKR